VEAGSTRVDVESILPGKSAPAAAAPAPVPVPAAAVASEAKGVYLQLGAFSSQEGADNFRVRVYRDLTWLSDTIQIVPAGAFYRLHLGPYRSQDEARPIADRIQAELSLRPVIVSR